MTGITTHVLDTGTGRPAQGVRIILFRQTGDDGQWQEIAQGLTDADGRLRDLLPKDAVVEKGIYKLRFGTKEYFAASLYPFVEIVFEIGADEHYHIPLLLSPFGYTTYRGS